MDKFTLQDLKQAYLIMLGKIEVDYTSAMLSYNACKDVVMSYFTSLIYDHRCMMYEDSKDAFRYVLFMIYFQKRKASKILFLWKIP